MQAQQIWSVDDWAADLCSREQIGKPKAEAVSDEQRALIEELPKATMAELKQAALRVARGTGSYDDFLLKNPGFHQKFLLSMVKEPLPPGPATVEVNISWLSPERLAYKQEVIEAPIVEDAKVLNWKEPEVSPQSLVKRKD